MASTYLKNGIVITMNPERDIYYGGAVSLKDGRISAVDKECSPDAEKTADQVIDCKGKILLPGFVDTHTHLFQNLLKGLGDDMALDKWLATMTFPAAKHLTPEHCYHAARAGLLEGLHSGITCTLDYMYPHNREGLSDAVIKAYQDMGVRGIFGRGCMDTGADFGVPTGIMQDTATIEKDLIRLYDRYHNKGLLKVGIAPAAMWSNSRKNLTMLRDMADSYKSVFTVHISETPFDRDAATRLHGKTDIEVLEDLKIMGPHVLMVHCVFLTEEDQRFAARHNMKVSHNTASNMYLSSGVAPVPAMLEKGIDVSLGVDGAASNNSQDMLEMMKLTALLHKVSSRNPTIISAEQVLEMATLGGARCLGLEEEIGSLEAGKRGDILIFDPMKSAKSVPLHNPVSTIVYSSSEKCIDTVMVDGEILLNDGVYLSSKKEDAILLNSQEAAEELCRLGGITNRMAGHHWNA
jgi:5-methylthioadenosine/S-adenosylhomocysteine deaminase